MKTEKNNSIFKKAMKRDLSKKLYLAAKEINEQVKELADWYDHDWIGDIKSSLDETEEEGGDFLFFISALLESLELNILYMEATKKLKEQEVSDK